MDTTTISAEELAKIKEYFERAVQLVRYNKGKDDVIEKTGKDIQHYRDGFVLWAFKPVALSLISYREACKKELEELDKYEYDVEKLKKNFNFLVDDAQDLLLENGVEETEGGYSYCGMDILAPLALGERKPLVAVEEKTEEVVEDAPATETVEEVAETPVEEPTVFDLEKTLAEYQQQLLAAIAENTKIDEYIKASFDGAREIDANNKRIVIYPIFHNLAVMKNNLAEQLQSFPQTEDAKGEYANVLANVIDTVCGILEKMGVRVDSEHSESDKIVSGFHQLLKVVPTEVEEDDRKIARKITDAYTLDGKVIYPQKVEVFKFKK